MAFKLSLSNDIAPQQSLAGVFIHHNAPLVNQPNWRPAVTVDVEAISSEQFNALQRAKSVTAAFRATRRDADLLQVTSA